MLSSEERVVSTSQILEFYLSRAEQEDLSVVPYLGERGYLAILKYLAEEKGWEIEDADGEYIYTLVRGTARTTVEADGKPEISASAYVSLHDLAEEILDHKNEIEEISKKLGISWMALGMEPFHSADEIALIPKKRYVMWDIIFKDHKEWMHTYMKAVAGTHFNFDYTDEANLVRKTQTMYRLAPLLAAMFATSPYEKGRRAPCLGMRRRKIFSEGFEQEKMMDGMLDPDFTFQKWIEWYLDQQVIIFPFDQTIIVPKGFTFKKWVEEGYEGRFPTFSDFDQHVKTRWTDIRFRPGYLELRVFDSLPYPLLMASAAFLKGLVFECESCDAVERITESWTEEMIENLHRKGCSEGLRTEVDGRTFLDIARELLMISSERLKCFGKKNAKGEDETIFLAPLERLLQKGISPAEDLVEYAQGDPQKIVEWSEKEF